MRYDQKYVLQNNSRLRTKASFMNAPRAGLRPARPPVGVKETWGGPAFP